MNCVKGQGLFCIWTTGFVIDWWMLRCFTSPLGCSVLINGLFWPASLPLFTMFNPNLKLSETLYFLEWFYSMWLLKLFYLPWCSMDNITLCSMSVGQFTYFIHEIMQSLVINCSRFMNNYYFSNLCLYTVFNWCTRQVRYI